MSNSVVDLTSFGYLIHFFNAVTTRHLVSGLYFKWSLIVVCIDHFNSYLRFRCAIQQASDCYERRNKDSHVIFEAVSSKLNKLLSHTTEMINIWLNYIDLWGTKLIYWCSALPHLFLRGKIR